MKAQRTRRALLGAGAGLVALAGAGCAPFGGPRAAGTGPAPTSEVARPPAATAIPPTPVPPTPTPEPTPTPAPEPEEWNGAVWRGRVDVLPQQPRQGQTVLLRVWSTMAQTVTATVENRNVQLVREGNAFVGLYGFSRVGRLGARPLRFTLADAAGRRVTRSDPADTAEVVDGQFPREELIFDDKALALLDPVKQAQENATLDRVQSQWTPEQLWHGPWAEAVGGTVMLVPLSSDFGILRSINGGPYNWSHEGTDFQVDTGDPVKAVADGRVAFAQELYVRGNTVVIDHGIGVFSMYNHMFKFDVQPGQMVKRSELIGLVGSTGFVTGPHLHLEIRVQNQQVEPLEWLQRPQFERPDLAAL